MKSIDRLYSYNHKCHECNHTMKTHTRLGCNISYCICKISNPTFTEFCALVALRENNLFNRQYVNKRFK